MTAIYIRVPKELIRRAIEALEARAQDSAGHSFGDQLHSAEETQEWLDAQAFRDLLKSE